MRISLLMLFESGAWTIASIMPFTMNKVLGSMMLVTITVSNISFLLTLLVTVLLYSEVGSRKKLRKTIVYLFSAGNIALVATVMLFMIVFLTTPPLFLD